MIFTINEHTKQHAIFKRREIIAVFILIKNVDDKSKLFIFTHEPALFNLLQFLLVSD